MMRIIVGEDIEPGHHVGMDPKTGMLVTLETINTVGAQGWAGERLKKGDVAVCQPDIAALWKKEVIVDDSHYIFENCTWNEQPVPKPVKPVSIDYTNWKGSRRTRKVLPITIQFIKSEWHPEEQWVLLAYDLEEESTPIKYFAMATIHGWTQCFSS